MANQLSAKQGEGSFIAAGTRLEGRIAFSGPTIVSGHLKGDVAADGLLVIEAGAIVDGNIDGTVIVVRGTLTGTVSPALTRFRQTYPHRYLSLRPCRHS